MKYNKVAEKLKTVVTILQNQIYAIENDSDYPMKADFSCMLIAKSFINEAELLLKEETAKDLPHEKAKGHHADCACKLCCPWMYA